MRAFNLEEAKAGKPLVTRDGRDAKFIAHVPECIPTNRLIAHISGRSVVYDYSEKGIYVGGDGDSVEDLFMKTVKKRSYFNIYKNGCWGVYSTEEHAKEMSQGAGTTALAIAVPVEI